MHDSGDKQSQKGQGGSRVKQAEMKTQGDINTRNNNVGTLDMKEPRETETDTFKPDTAMCVGRQQEFLYTVQT